MGKLTLDLHDIFKDGDAIDAALNRVISTAVEKKIRLVEIIPGKGSGQLRRRVMRFLHQPRIRDAYHRLEIDELNHGKMYVHFKF